jgi:hypothetical protein
MTIFEDGSFHARRCKHRRHAAYFMVGIIDIPDRSSYTPSMKSNFLSSKLNILPER